ncbi:UDP-2,3-diacylglucosamine pyrophosphatase LpxH [Natronoarchaeum philippinense]|uniref:UDP-2,3-diacylglucosamine pyrophosphatase LpxH n=1 Tax=Natronoarchaeum philippinense TaxID=558529 RepID=A0A285NR33_NATPI|nr:UDP-2,3-diacylglucosamine pyrophosphatase LpxH [Natronoarchaeum philippinense]
MVLLGDVWDMIRRDPFGSAWETSETITRLRRLADELPVYFVFGNHDTHLRNLDTSLYDVAFRDEVVLDSGDASIRFRHGKAFDRLQFDALSNSLSGPGDRGDIDPTRGAKDPIVAKGRSILQAQKRRLESVYETIGGGDEPDHVTASDGGAEPADPTYPRRERRAHTYLERIPEDKLIYGHTHSPYVHPDNVAANPGSWKSTAPVHNTYLVIEDGDIELYQHDADGADAPIAAEAFDDGLLDGEDDTEQSSVG